MSYTDIIVRYAETDQMGIVHHSVYPVWFEAARTDMMEQAGYSYARMEREGIMLPLSHLECDYKGGVRYGETVTIRCFIEKLTIARLCLGYEVRRKGEDGVLCSGTTVHGWTDTDLHVINLKKKAPELFEFLEKM
ncbi:MAG: thioesterase family protein [Spirochaetales bacterium]|uniref:Thioesterase family protein n=1 Tax=Candidatus Thalassospirochaeta sargassi TaxID=3119039 RepID=A0AAJ1MPB8_9SPIO|nr:thioesterase family protein [Spirochaetales bacterium]